MGRHSSRARRPRRFSAVAVVLVVLGGAGWVAASVVRDRTGCDRPVVVRVAAAPAVATPLAQVARRVAQTGCAAFEVNAVDSAAVARSLALPGGADRPDVWIPESTLQLRRAKGVGAGEVAAGTSIASSPVVFALTEAAAAGLGWPGRTPAWADALGAADLSLGMPDPGREPAGLSALIGIRAALPGADAYVAALRRLSPNTVPATEDLVARLTDAAQPVSGFPVPENALLRYNLRTGTQSGLVAAYQAEAPALDYPFAVLGGTGEAERAAAEALLSALLGLEGMNALADAGFRTPDGRYLRDGAAQNVSDRTQPSPAEPTDADVDALLGQWALINSSSRARVLIDVSGSMNAVVPGSGGQTRMQLTADAAARGLTLFKPTSESSVWEFATRLDGDLDYREVLPMRPVSEQLATGAGDRLRSIRATPDGDTGLYDTVLAAYRLAVEEWQPGRLNLVIVLTDGRNDDGGGISRDALVAELSRLGDPRRPVPIIGIGIGPDIDLTELAAITTPTGGQTFAAPDPARITDVFYGALARLTGA